MAEPIPVFRTTQNNGNVVIPMRAKEYIKNLPKIVELVVRPWRKKRTNQQNRYLWGVPYALIADYTGMDKDSVHEFLTAKFLPNSITIESKRGEKETIETARSTTRLTTTEFNCYVKDIRSFAARFFEISIPLPDDCEY